KQESGIKRRSSHFSCVNTVPVNTYAPVGVATMKAHGDGAADLRRVISPGHSPSCAAVAALCLSA
ncbi:hypothetical protein, partial [Aeromonas hydrophila]